MKVGEALGAMRHGLAVHDDLLDLQRPHRLGDGNELSRPIAAVAAPQPNLVAILSGDDPIAVVLDSTAAARSLVGERGTVTSSTLSRSARVPSLDSSIVAGTPGGYD